MLSLNMDNIFKNDDSSFITKTTNKTYHCQRCLNHGLAVPRKGHKRCCVYADCSCYNCSLVKERKQLNREINIETERDSSVIGMDEEEITELQPAKVKVRHPKCARCAIHLDTEPPPLKGHKRKCPYQNCVCRKCQLVAKRRVVMAKQIHLRRIQRAKQDVSPCATAEPMFTSQVHCPRYQGSSLFSPFDRKQLQSDESSTSTTLSDKNFTVINPLILPTDMPRSGIFPSPFATCWPKPGSLSDFQVQINSGIKTLALPIVPAPPFPSTPPPLPFSSSGSTDDLDGFRPSTSSSLHPFRYYGLDARFGAAVVNPLAMFGPNMAFFLYNNSSAN